MKLKKLFGNWNNTIKTFPISHILLVAISAIWIGNIEGLLSDHFSYRTLIALAFAFLLSCLGPIIQIHSNFKNKNTINRILQISALVLGAIYYFILTKIKNAFDATYSEGLLYFGIIILAILLIPLLIAILHKKNEPKIWFSWNSLITSLIYGGIAGSIVRGGIAGALGSIEALFDVNIVSERYGYIGVLSEILFAGSFVFNYYLTLVENINDKKSEFKIETSRIRRIFGSFIFLPLALVYLLIFGAYGIKILVTGIWPNGIIVWLGIGYFALGVISAYMIYPEKTKIHEIIYKILYISFILIALMMIGAISQRIDQYGITINRRFICFMITLIILHSILSLIFTKKRLISFISLLFILTLLALYGPINGSNISYKSQVNKLQNILSKENIELPLSESSLKDLDPESQNTIAAIVEELTEKYNKNKVFNEIISYNYNGSYRSYRYEIREYLGIDSNNDYYNSDTYFNYWQDDSDNTIGIDIAGYSKLYKFQKYDEDTRNNILRLNVDNQEYRINLSTHIEELKEKSDLYKKGDNTNEELNELKKPALILNGENYRLIITGFHGEQNKSNKKIQFRNIEGYILIK